MTGPNVPTQNPGGQPRRSTRVALCQWIEAQQIRGLAHVYPSRSAQVRFDDWPGGAGADFAALAKILTWDDSENREAYTGPTGRGGKLLNYQVGLQVIHQSYNPDDNQTGEAEDDYDRTVDALKDALRGPGRDLGRPEVILHVGEWPRVGGIIVRSDPPADLGDLASCRSESSNTSPRSVARARCRRQRRGV
jgi:hypothetical protein